MTSPSLKGSGSVSAANALKLLGVQVDIRNDVWGGQKFLFDYTQSALGDSLAASTNVPNLIVNGPAATILGAFASGCTAAKGLAFTEADTNFQTVSLPDDIYDLNNLPNKSSFLISIWATHGAIPASPNATAIAGFGVGTGNIQWGFALASSGSGTKAYFDDAQMGSFAANTIGVPTLYTIAVVKTGNDAYTATFYADDVAVGTKTGTYGGFEAPASGQPLLGTIIGFTNNWNGTIHRASHIRFDPAVFDVAEWLAEEIAGVGSVFA